MSITVISVENLSKSYQLGAIGTGTFKGDVQRWWAKLRGLPDPHIKIGEKDHGNRDGETIWALKDINFQVQQGEAVGIIGRNGAGKSTLLKILSRVTAPTSGEIKVKGKIASLLEVGTGFHPELTGRENIFMNGAIMGMDRSEIQRKFNEIVDFSGVEKYIDTPVKRYSSGMYVRLAFSVAAHLEPDILIVDEVLSVGDEQFQKKCIGKMEEVGKQGRTVLFVSHSMGTIMNLCNRALMVDFGTIRYSGAVLDAITEYRGTIKRGTLIDLSSFSVGRRGIQEFAKFMSISVYDENNQQSDIFAMGETMYIRLQIYIKKPVKHPRIGIMLRSSMDALIHDFVSAYEGFLVELEEGIYTFEIVVPEINVYPGTYTLGPWIQKQVGIPSDDYISAALKITVVDNKLVGHKESKFDVISKEGTETYHLSKWSIA